ncbi:MAG: hypothetical protein JWO59_1466 [Chloroflexi bacterium]|nr:hypothetical protein [Chloroflexota bacterium]
MRDALQPFDGQRLTVRGTVARLATRKGWAKTIERTILLAPIVSLDGVVLTDHLWLGLGRRIASLEPRLGDVLQFDGRARLYRKNSAREHGEAPKYCFDYGLAYPSRCMVIERGPEQSAPPLTMAAPLAIDILEPETPPRERILQGIEGLVLEIGEPPSLKRLYAHLGRIAPFSFLRHLHKLAKDGRITYLPDGHVFIVPPGQIDEGTQQ